MRRVVLLVISIIFISTASVSAQGLCGSYNPAPQEMLSGSLPPAALVRAPAVRAARRNSVRVQGILYPEVNTCAGTTITSLASDWVVKQKGRNFTVVTAQGLVLRGKGGRSGFTVRARTGDGYWTYYHTVSFGKVHADRTTNVYVQIDAVCINGCRCKTAWSGTFLVG